jgi:hypothetical protein
MSFRGFAPRGRGRGRGASGSGASGSGPPVSSAIQGATQGMSSSSGHKKTSSADKKKKMRESLGGDAGGQGSRDASGPPPKTHLLLVQGGTHTAFLGDFLALVEFFQTQTSPAFAADFWTMYGPQQYFEEKRNEKYTTIKFENRVMANRHNTEHHTQPYTYVDPTQICQRVFQWLDIKADATHELCAKPGDSIILIILAHGSWQDDTPGPVGIRLGNNDMLVGDFVTALRRIPRDVQVNVISNACYSALFAQNIAADKQALRWIQVASQPLQKAFAADWSASGRFQNSGFIAGLVRSLAGLGRNNRIDLGTLQNELTAATEANTTPQYRTSQFSYSDSPLTTQVHTLLLRGFADYPFTPQNSAARRRKELNFKMLKRPFPVGAALMDKQDFAASMIAEEHDSFGSQVTEMLDDGFEGMTRFDSARKNCAGEILCGMLIRGRLQAAVFNVFMQLCLQGVCSLSALEHPIDWNIRAPAGTCRSWILCMLGVFNCSRVNWDWVQEKWGISRGGRWVEYGAPINWLATMIGRSFTSLDVVFDIIRTTNQLGPIHVDSLKRFVEGFQPDGEWEADINLNRAEEWYGSGTFAFWLPENVDASIIQQGFDDAARALSKDFYQRLERTEMHYAVFFDISRDVFDADVQQGERDVRDWVMEDD